jgi:S-adenosylmethionine:tRNA ribosyltransferase-isomerase
MVAFNAHAAQGGDPLSAYDYRLPPELVAQEPAERRVRARLLVLPREGGELVHQRVAQLTRWLKPGDLLVLNDTKVVPARLWARKPSGGRVELMLLSPARPLASGAAGAAGEVHEALLRSHRPLAEGQELEIQGDPPVQARVLERGARGRAKVWLSAPALEVAAARGKVPLPPYIKRPQGPTARDRQRYQTVYAAREGAVAAPTAGLHFSPELLAALRRRGVETASLTLHVGYGTFAEPSAADLMEIGRAHV